MSFADDIKKFADKTNKNAEEVATVFIIKLFTGIIYDTRVDTGRLRGNWQCSTGTPILTPIDRLDPNGTSTKLEAERTVDGLKVNYLTNNLPYAKRWNDEDGYIETNLARTRRNLREAVRDVV